MNLTNLKTQHITLTHAHTLPSPKPSHSSCIYINHSSNSTYCSHSITDQKMKLILAALLLCSLLLSNSFLEPAMAAEDSVFCGSKCKSRCAKAGVQDRCLKYCGICCKECKCVPSGTYGNKHECACYRDKLNKKGKPKCP